MTATYAPWGTSAWAVCVRQGGLSAAPEDPAHPGPATLVQVSRPSQGFIFITLLAARGDMLGCLLGQVRLSNTLVATFMSLVSMGGRMDA
jgi:hypothetical protein